MIILDAITALALAAAAAAAGLGEQAHQPATCRAGVS
jgi:hypothetical protein